MMATNEKAMRFGSVVKICHKEDLSNMIAISDGFVDLGLNLMKPKRMPSQSLIRGLFIILPPTVNEIKVAMASLRPEHWKAWIRSKM